ncbi:MAG: sigma 54-interacting transcriptional regulator [Phycisphaerales bacterium]|nr:sigma 54-interacting transcriptional regulator [Phycisphaerales bacterium]
MKTLGFGAACDYCLTREPSNPLGDSPCMKRLHPLIETVSRRSCTILLQGESGTGKELLAHHIHAMSPRRLKPFVPVDCTALCDTLFESQLFGHAKGAFTGADKATPGFLRAADGGTLFLDEIGELNLPVQAKLLRCIQERTVVPVGSVESIPIDVRIITATHRDLRGMVGQGRFRQDLFFRLNVMSIVVPPLRERGSDILMLAEHFLEQFALMDGESAKRLSPEAIQLLLDYSWPGNVRELANAMEQAHILSKQGMVTCADLPQEIRSAHVMDKSETETQILPLATVECALIKQALRAAAGNQSRAADMLQIDRRRLYRKIRRYGLAELVQ